MHSETQQPRSIEAWTGKDMVVKLLSTYYKHTTDTWATKKHWIFVHRVNSYNVSKYGEKIFASYKAKYYWCSRIKNKWNKHYRMIFMKGWTKRLSWNRTDVLKTKEFNIIFFKLESLCNACEDGQLTHCWSILYSCNYEQDTWKETKNNCKKKKNNLKTWHTTRMNQLFEAKQNAPLGWNDR